MSLEAVPSKDRSTDRLLTTCLQMKDESFPKKSRIRTKKEYGFLYSQSKRVNFLHGRFLFFAINAPFLRLGISVSKKVGGAVVRNRMKRLLRYWFRTQAKAIGQGVDLVIQLDPSSKEVQVSELFEALSKTFREYMQLLQMSSDKKTLEELCSKKS